MKPERSYRLGNGDQVPTIPTTAAERQRRRRRKLRRIRRIIARQVRGRIRRRIRSAQNLGDLGPILVGEGIDFAKAFDLVSAAIRRA